MKCFTPLLLLLFASPVFAQELSLDSAQQYARQHYPLLKQRQALDEITALQLRNIRTGYLPQAELNGPASCQSAVTTVPIKPPGVNSS